jgi:galactose oxidase
MGLRIGLLCLFVVCLGFSREVAAQTDVVGRWSRVPDLPFAPIHSHMLPTGKVMMWPGLTVSGDDPRLWDPATATVTTLAKSGYDLFCTGHSFLADGRLFVAGGTINFTDDGLPNASAYDPFTDTWTRVPDMNAG